MKLVSLFAVATSLFACGAPPEEHAGSSHEAITPAAGGADGPAVCGSNPVWFADWTDVADGWTPDVGDALVPLPSANDPYIRAVLVHGVLLTLLEAPVGSSAAQVLLYPVAACPFGSSTSNAASVQHPPPPPNDPAGTEGGQFCVNRDVIDYAQTFLSRPCGQDPHRNPIHTPGGGTGGGHTWQ